jgi:hypothetical protein
VLAGTEGAALPALAVAHDGGRRGRARQTAARDALVRTPLAAALVEVMIADSRALEAIALRSSCSRAHVPPSWMRSPSSNLPRGADDHGGGGRIPALRPAGAGDVTSGRLARRKDGARNLSSTADVERLVADPG